MKSTLWMVALMLPMSALAGKKDKEPKIDPDHANFFQPVAPIGDEITVGLEDIWARDEDAKLKVRVLNGTRDWVVYQAAESRFDFGSGEVVPKRAKLAAIAPKSARARVLSVQGSGMHQESFKFLAKGVYRVPADTVKPYAAPDMQLPLATSSFDTGPFSCNIPGKVKQETDETKVRFVCTFSGPGIGLFDPTKLQVRLEDGQVFANDDRKTESTVVTDGEEFKFAAVFHVSAKIVDMQFATMHVVFNDTLQSGDLVRVPFDPIVLEIDQALTAEKN